MLQNAAYIFYSYYKYKFMKKNRERVLLNTTLRKYLIKFKLSLFFFLLGIVQVFAVEGYSQQTRLSLSFSQTKLENVLNEIENQSEYYFLYNQDFVDVDQFVDIRVKDQKVEPVLDHMLSPIGISFAIYDRQIILMSKEQENTGIIASIINVKGHVKDYSGTSLPGVTVIIKGTATGTITDIEGNYNLLNVPSDAALIFSFIGMKTQEISVAGKSNIDVILLEETIGIDEVVAIGYGTQKKSTVTESIVTIKANELKTTTTGNTANMLAGKLPGLRVTQRSSEPGDYATDYDIRGFGAPLVVVDGVPRSSFNRLDPNEIESVSVLKDASAAVYGVKGGNGVILITTKRGEKGKTEFNFSSNYGLISPTKIPRFCNAYEYATLTDESYLNGNGTPPYSREVLDQYKNGTLPSTDWYGAAVNKYSPQQQYNISASGSSEKIKYFASLGYFDEVGLWKTGDLNANRYNFRSNVTADLTSNLQAEVLIGGFKDTKNSPGSSSGIFQSLYTVMPTISVYANNNPDYLSYTPDAAHPLAITNSGINGYVDNTTYSLNGTVDLIYKIPKINGLKAKILYAYDFSNAFAKSWSKSYTVYNYDNATDTYPVAGIAHNPSSLSQSYTQNSASTVQASLEYENTFKSKHNVKVLILAEERKQSGLAFQGSRQFSLDAVDQLYAGNTKNQATTSTAIDPNVNMGIVGRINYNYKEKYMLVGSFREDGSSKFAEGNRWGFFPAFSAGWKISEESFLKDKVNFLSNLKLKVSYGKLGDDASSTYQYLSGYNYPGTNYVFGGALVNGLGFRGLANENLTWYTNKLFNTGIEADLFNNQLHIEADFFRKKREGLLATRTLSLPGTVGASLPQENLNSDLTKGVEFMFDYRDHIKDFKFNISGNIAYTRTKNIYIEQADPTNSYSNWRNNSANRWNDNYFGYKVIGQFQTMDEILNSPVEDGTGNRNVLPGDLKYEDLNKDGMIDGNDMQIVGNGSTTPELTFGLTLDMKWHGFDLNALFQGASLFSVSYVPSIAYDSPLPWGRNGLAVFMDRWHHEDLFDPSSPWIPGKYPSTRIKGGITRVDSWNYASSDFWLRDASYLRLKSLEIGYTLPVKLTKNYIKSMRVFVNGYNLITWSGLNDLIDPEHPNTSYGLFYPITKSYNFGVNITF